MNRAEAFSVQYVSSTKVRNFLDGKSDDLNQTPVDAQQPVQQQQHQQQHQEMHTASTDDHSPGKPQADVNVVDPAKSIILRETCIFSVFENLMSSILVTHMEDG